MFPFSSAPKTLLKLLVLAVLCVFLLRVPLSDSSRRNGSSIFGRPLYLAQASMRGTALGVGKSQRSRRQCDHFTSYSSAPQSVLQSSYGIYDENDDGRARDSSVALITSVNEEPEATFSKHADVTRRVRHRRELFYSATSESQIEYAKHQKYRLTRLRGESLLGTESGSKEEKFAFLLAALSDELGRPATQRVKWLFWIPRGTFVANIRISLGVFLPPPECNEVQLIAPAVNGARGDEVGDGVFGVRVHSDSMELLAAMLSLSGDLPMRHWDLSDQHVPGRPALTSLAAELHGRRFRNMLVPVPPRWFHAIPIADPADKKNNHLYPPRNVFHRGDPFLHFDTLRIDDNEWNRTVKEIKPEPRRYRIDLRDTSFQPAKQFWSNYRSAKEPLKDQDTLSIRNRVRDIVQTEKPSPLSKDEEEEWDFKIHALDEMQRMSKLTQEDINVFGNLLDGLEELRNQYPDVTRGTIDTGKKMEEMAHKAQKTGQEDKKESEVVVGNMVGLPGEKRTSKRAMII